jgi:8-oxo-dGTP pyrophosphatase MutT (NUDIX family)
MRIRATAILIENDQLAVMERHRAGRHYFTFPGGGVNAGETPDQAVVREIEEELGLQVRVICKVAEVWYLGSQQIYFLVERTGGVFGTGAGEEFGPERPDHGAYHPMWMNIADLLDHPLYPIVIAELVITAQTEGWPRETLILHEDAH